MFISATVHGQAFSGVHKFDGEHRNEVTGYLLGGHNVLFKAFGGY